MKKPRDKVLAVVCLLIATGCASIVDGRKEPVSFSSDPPGAQIFINGMPMGVTPASIVLERSDFGKANVIFKKEGYQDQQAILETSLNMWFFGNVIFGWVIGSSTDAVTGAMWKFAPNSYYVSMPPLKASLTEQNRFAYEKTVRRFLLYRYGELVCDVAKGEGENLASLYQLLSVNADRRSEVLARLQGLVFSTDSPPAFTNAVINESGGNYAPATVDQVLISAK